MGPGRNREGMGRDREYQQMAGSPPPPLFPCANNGKPYDPVQRLYNWLAAVGTVVGGAGGGSYKAVAAAIGVGRKRLERDWHHDPTAAPAPPRAPTRGRASPPPAPAPAPGLTLRPGATPTPRPTTSPAWRIAIRHTPTLRWTPKSSPDPA